MPVLSGALIKMCLPSTAPTQLGNCHFSLKLEILKKVLKLSLRGKYVKKTTLNTVVVNDEHKYDHAYWKIRHDYGTYPQKMHDYEQKLNGQIYFFLFE